MTMYIKAGKLLGHNFHGGCVSAAAANRCTACGPFRHVAGGRLRMSGAGLRQESQKQRGA